MYHIKIDVECPEGVNEVLPDALEDVALLVEDRVSLILLELFGMVSVNTVSISYVHVGKFRPNERPTG